MNGDFTKPLRGMVSFGTVPLTKLLVGIELQDAIVSKMDNAIKNFFILKSIMILLQYSTR